MAQTTFQGPVKSGTILNTVGTTLGQDVKNVGDVILSQTDTLAYTNSTAKSTNIVLPKDSQVVDIKIAVSTQFNNTTTATIKVGTTAGNATTLINAVSVLSSTGLIAPGSAANVSNWTDVGTTDRRVTVTCTGTGGTASTGAARVTVFYVQSRNLV